MLQQLLKLDIIKDYHEITGVGHRVVAGGEIFQDSALINDQVLKDIEDLKEYAPLHNPANATGIRAFKKILPDITSVAVFDTSFHGTLPEKNYLYSIPYEYYEKYGARKYGAHGTSHRYVAGQAAKLMQKPLELKCRCLPRRLEHRLHLVQLRRLRMESLLIHRWASLR